MSALLEAIARVSLTRRSSQAAEPGDTRQREDTLFSLVHLTARACRVPPRLTGDWRVSSTPAVSVPIEHRPRRDFRHWRLHIGTLLAALLWFCITGPALANILVLYTPQNLADTTAGEDLWQYDYQVSGHDFLAGESLVLYFDFGAFEAIAPVSGPSPDWGLDAAEPDKFLGPGIFVATAPAAPGVGPLAFSVRFHWLQPARPMDQAFDLFGPEPEYALLDSGRSSPEPIPEPSLGLLLLIGLALLLVARHKRVFSTSPR